MIPGRLVRTVPTETTDEVERFWQQACDLHPDWDHITFRDPIDPADFPITSPHWPLVSCGAQLAGLIRLEALWHEGGFYIDSDLELFRSLADLQHCEMVGTWEDDDVVPDWFLGSEPDHPAIALCLDLAITRLKDRDNPDWTTGPCAWGTGPGVTNTILPGRTDVTLLHPSVLAPYHYSELHREYEPHHVNPVCLGAHRWRHSWLGH